MPEQPPSKKPKAPKQRLDTLLVEQGLCETRSKAQALIMAGQVRVNGQKQDKAGTLLDPVTSELAVLESLPYVSRGGLKLAHALQVFNIAVKNRVCLDVGASTGGFTDCLLQHEAQKVYAVDVGTNQLDWRLRQDSRVVVMEQTHVAELKPDRFANTPPDLAVVDVSFISLKKVLPLLPPLLLSPQTAERQTAEIIALLKPQFEYLDYARATDKPFNGIVALDGVEGTHQHVVASTLKDLQALMPPDWALVGLAFSPIQGGSARGGRAGNTEVLTYWQKGPQSSPADDLERQLLRLYNASNLHVTQASSNDHQSVMKLRHAESAK